LSVVMTNAAESTMSFPSWKMITIGVN
jgi:hypothetical protein